MAEFYNGPFSFKKLVSKERLEKVDLKLSIENHIKGMLMTDYHSYRFDSDYGCYIKDHDFELITNDNSWRHVIERNLQESITNHETRLKNVRVRVKIEDYAKSTDRTSSGFSLRKKLVISITGVVKATDNSHQFPDINIFISPLSFM